MVCVSTFGVLTKSGKRLCKRVVNNVTYKQTSG